jgi:hypothetical protein
MSDPRHPSFAPEQTLDPADWDVFRAQAHRLLDACIDRMATYREGAVWNPFPPELKAAYQAPLPAEGWGA